MSLRIVLDKEAMLAAGAEIKEEVVGFKEYARREKILHLNGRKFEVSSDGSLYFHGGDLHYEVPTDLKAFVTEVSHYDNFGVGLSSPQRQVGEYRLASAIGELSTVGRSHYHLKLHAKNPKDLYELYSLIREGRIWPAKDYEAEQVPPPCRHLRSLISEAWELVRRNIGDRLYRIRERVAH